jgi:hypothetical protein
MSAGKVSSVPPPAIEFIAPATAEISAIRRRRVTVPPTARCGIARLRVGARRVS